MWVGEVGEQKERERGFSRGRGKWRWSKCCSELRQSIIKRERQVMKMGNEVLSCWEKMRGGG